MDQEDRIRTERKKKEGQLHTAWHDCRELPPSADERFVFQEERIRKKKRKTGKRTKKWAVPLSRHETALLMNF